MSRASTLYPFFLLIAFSANLFAQPLTGTKTIGGDAPDYPTIHAAVDAMNDRGVANGGVIFRLRGGNYNDSSFTIALHLNSNQRVSFSVDSGATVFYTIRGITSDTGLIKLKSSFITFDGSWSSDDLGRHFTIINSGVSPLNIIWFTDSASHNMIKNCVIACPPLNTVNSCLTVGFDPDSINDHIVGNSILNCDIVGGLLGLRISGNMVQAVDSTIISGCNFFGFEEGGIAIETCAKTFITHNKIYDNLESDMPVTAINIGYGTSDARINANEIDNLHTQNGPVEGIYVYSDIGGNIVSNNMITLGNNTEGDVYGMNVYNGSTSNKYLFNSINVHGVGINSMSFGFFFAENGAAQDTLCGNIIQNTRSGGTILTGGHCAIYTAAASLYSDFNLLTTGNEDTSDNRFVAMIVFHSTNTDTTYNTLAQLRSSSWFPNDQHSITEITPFIADSDLHIQSGVPTGLESGALHYWQVLTDFDDDIRTSPMCDIGADEGNFTPLSVKNESVTIPQGFSVSPIYPNPFNSTATIRFSLPVASTVKGEVFDITGRKVATLINGKFNVGEHRIQFDGSKLASGVYLVRMSAGKFSKQQKMILLK